MATTALSPPGAPAALRLRRHHIAHRVARRLVHTTCDRSWLPAGVVDAAAVLAGELVRCSAAERRAGLSVSVEVDAAGVTVRVRDGSVDRAPFGSSGSAAARRRGEVVRRLATAWGCATGAGERQVWATLRVPELHTIVPAPPLAGAVRA